MILVATGHLISDGFDPCIGRFQRRRSISTLVAVGGQAELCSSINENLDRLAIGDIFARSPLVFGILIAFGGNIFTFFNFSLSLARNHFYFSAVI